MLKIDLGCGIRKAEGFVGIDIFAFRGVDIVTDLLKPWPWGNESVDEARASHLVEHFTSMQRVHFVNELHRVLKPKAKATIICPHWASCRAYGDPTHIWPPVSEFWFYYLSKKWRMGDPMDEKFVPNAPHTDHSMLPGGFNCDFESTWGYSFDNTLAVRSQDYQVFALANFKDSAMDILATLVKV